MKRLKSLFITAVFCLYFLFGCANTGPIPSGKYAMTAGDGRFVLTESNSVEFYLKIEGDKGKYYESRALAAKFNIVEENGKIYFESYQWFDILLWKEIGRTFKYEVTYDKATNTITILY